MPTTPLPARRRAAVLLTLGLALLAGGCSASAPATDAPTWPAAFTVPDDTTTTYWYAWTAVAQATSDAEAQLQPEIDKLAAAGYTTALVDPGCQTGAEDLLVKLTGYPDIVAVGVPFASAADVGAFDTLYDGPLVSVTTGTNACAA